MQSAALDATHYAAQYELLRAQVMGSAYPSAGGHNEAQPARGIGLALLLREGMPGWVKALEAVIRASAAPLALESLCSGRIAPPALPSAQRHEITTLLASLVLSTRRLASVSSTERCPPCQ